MGKLKLARLLSMVVLLGMSCCDSLWGQDFPISTSDTNVGYIDTATIANRVRFRFDAGFDMFPPDRAEFFYAAGPSGSPPNRVDYQEFAAYFEYALSDCFSGFIEAPLRLINPDISSHSTGIADINLGIKALLLSNESSRTTFQLRAYLPTGDDDRRLGTGNVSIEPALLQYQRLSEKWLMENEFRVWVPLTDDNSAGAVLRYGAGISYTHPNQCPCQLSFSPVFEMVGWTVLDGEATTTFGPPTSASGDTIVNAKLGLRISYRGEQIYAGMGQSLTSDRWYNQLARIEYRIDF